MNRLKFASDEAIVRSIIPGPGQRWVFALTPEECEAKVLKMPPERRAMMSQLFKVNRERGYVIVGKDETTGDWLVHRNPKNPHPRSKVVPLKNKWLEQYKFVGYEEIA